MRAVWAWVCLCITGCASVQEVRGDALLAGGDESGALAAYAEAMKKRPIIDWEFEHLRDKRLRILEGRWSPTATEVISRTAKLRGPEAIPLLLSARREMRDGAATVPLMRRMDEAVLKKLVASEWGAPEATSVAARVQALLVILEELRTRGGTKEQLDALVARLDEALQAPLPKATSWRERLSQLLAWRRALRSAGVPAAVDARLARELSQFDSAVVEPAEPIEAHLAESVSLLADSRALGGGVPAIGFAQASVKDDVTRFLELEKSEAAAGRYFQAVLSLARWSSRVEDARIHDAMLEYAKAGSEKALERARAAGSTGRGWLFASMALALGGDATLRSSLGGSLGTATALSFTPQLTGSCAASSQLTSAFGSGPAGRLSVNIQSCGAQRSDTTQSRSESYTQTRTVLEPKEVQVGTRLERMQVGSHKVQCTQSSSLPGMVWQGLCDVPDYETKQFPVFETRLVPVPKEVNDSVRYDVGIHVWAAGVAAEARFVTDEGTVLTASADQRSERREETYAYDVPGPTETAPATHRGHTLPADFSGDGPLSSAASSLGRALYADLRDQWVLHRTKVALEQARAAVREGRSDDATDAFVRAALIGGKVDDEIAAHLRPLTALDGKALDELLSAKGSSVLGGAAASANTSEPARYEPVHVVTVDDAWVKVSKANARDVSVSTETYQEGIYPPNEFVDFHVGLVPGEIQAGAFGAFPGAMVGLEGHYSPLEWLGLRYFFAVHDEIGLRYTMGVKLFKGRDSDAGSETGFAFSLDGHYTLVAGLRLPWFSVMAGARAGLMHMAVGELNAGGFHFEPAARIALRFFEQKQLILEASGFVGIPGVPFKNRFALSFPLLGKDGIDIMLSIEQTNFLASDLGPDGKTRVSLGILPVHQAGLQVGGRL